MMRPPPLDTSKRHLQSTQAPFWSPGFGASSVHPWTARETPAEETSAPRRQPPSAHMSTGSASSTLQLSMSPCSSPGSSPRNLCMQPTRGCWGTTSGDWPRFAAVATGLATVICQAAIGSRQCAHEDPDGQQDSIIVTWTFVFIAVSATLFALLQKPPAGASLFATMPTEQQASGSMSSAVNASLRTSSKAQAYLQWDYSWVLLVIGPLMCLNIVASSLPNDNGVGPHGLTAGGCSPTGPVSDGPMAGYRAGCLTLEIRLAVEGVVAVLFCDIVLRHLVLPLQSPDSSLFPVVGGNEKEALVAVSAMQWPTMLVSLVPLAAFVGAVWDVRIEGGLLGMVLLANTVLAPCFLHGALWHAYPQDETPPWLRCIDQTFVQSAACLSRAVPPLVYRVPQYSPEQVQGLRLEARWLMAGTATLGLLGVSVFTVTKFHALLCLHGFNALGEVLTGPALGYSDSQAHAMGTCDVVPGDWSIRFFALDNHTSAYSFILIPSFLLLLLILMMFGHERVMSHVILLAQQREHMQTTAMLRWLSHECRSPVAAALLGIETIDSDLLPDLRRQLRVMHEAAARKPVEEPAPTAQSTDSAPNTQGNGGQLLRHSAFQSTDVVADSRGCREVIEDIESSTLMVRQPLQVLADILDNMLLYMRRHRSVRREHSLNAMSNTLQALDVSSAISVAWMNTRASRDVHGHAAELSVSFCASIQALLQSSRSRESCTSESLGTLFSSATQATLVQVLTNFFSNAVKYGKEADCPTAHVQVHGTLLQSHDQCKSLLPTGFHGIREVCALLNKSRSLGHSSLGSPSSSRSRSSLATREMSPQRGCLLALCVSDQGMGMTAEEASRLFRPFSRLRSGSGAIGNGLGLWLMRELVQSQGGDVAAFSAGLGHGSTFIALFPVVQREDSFRVNKGTPDASVAAASDAPESSTNSGEADSPVHRTRLSIQRLLGRRPRQRPDPPVLRRRPASALPALRPAHTSLSPYSAHPALASAPAEHDRMHILLVEDSAPIRTMLARQLARKGHDVVQAEDGVEALEALQATLAVAAPHPPFDVVVTDMTMPRLGGDGLSSAILAQFAQPPCRVHRPAILGVTGNVMSDDIDSFKAAGADEVLSKPTSAQDILATARALLQAQAPGRGVGRAAGSTARASCFAADSKQA